LGAYEFSGSTATETVQKNEIISSGLNVYSYQNGAIKIFLPIACLYKITIHAINGQKVTGAFKGLGSAGQNTVSLRSSRLSQGAYIVRIAANGSTVDKSIIIVR